MSILDSFVEKVRKNGWKDQYLDELLAEMYKSLSEMRVPED